jgi:hypothetical protein
MNDRVLQRWLKKRRIEVSACLGYVALTSLAYLVIFVTRAEADGLWIFLYIAALPISWVINQIVARMLDYLPQGIGGFLYSTQVILAGAIWIYVVARFVTWLVAFLKAKIDRSQKS